MMRAEMRVSTSGGGSVTVKEVDGKLFIEVHPGDGQAWELQVPVGAIDHMTTVGGGGGGRGGNTTAAAGSGGGAGSWQGAVGMTGGFGGGYGVYGQPGGGAVEGSR